MDKSQSDNPCFRCGKQRVVVGTHKELVGNSTIVVTNTSCPDPECQKKLDEKLRKEDERRRNLIEAKYAQNNTYFRSKNPTPR